jgi:hypothetical protein
VLLVRALPPGGRLRERSNTASLNAGVRARLIPELLAYDSGFNVRNTTRPGVAAATTWYWLNGLTLDHRLGEVGFVSARAARQDSDQLRGHEYGYLWGASLSVNELPTLGHGINYSGQANFTRAGTTTANSLVLTTNAVPYRGIAFGFVGSYGIATSGTGRTSVTRSLGVDSSVQPHPVLQLHGAFNHGAVVSTGASLGRASHETDTLEASATLRPVRAFFVTGTVSRVINPPNTATLYNASLGLNATAGGDLQLTVSYASVLDQEGAITRFFTPSARWNIRPNAVLTASYTMVDGDRSGGGSQHQRVLTLDLRITL